MAGKPVPAELRFWPKVAVGGPDDCWLWQGGVQGSGYGQFFRSANTERPQGRAVGAHRYSWELAHGRPAPKGTHVMHLCDVRRCVNPAHLRLGTCQENAADAARKGRNPGNRTSRGGPPRKLDRAMARAMRDKGMTYEAIAQATGVRRSTVWRAING